LDYGLGKPVNSAGFVNSSLRHSGLFTTKLKASRWCL